MSMYVDSNSKLHHLFDQHFTLNCPHCEVLSHVTAVSIPQYNQLMRFKPKQAGIVYRCDSCNSPLFLKFSVKSYGSSRVEFSTHYTEIERRKEKFDFTYLPEDAELLFKEALTCYSTSSFNAFVSMCRRTAHAVFRDLGESGKLHVFDQFNAIKDMAEIDEDTFGLLRKAIFEEGDFSLPRLNAAQAGILLEAMKDMLYESYVRKGKMQQAMMIRKYFLDENDNKIAHIKKAT